MQPPRLLRYEFIIRLSQKILLASSNRDKFEEFQDLFRSYPEIELVPAQSILRNAENLQLAEKYQTYLENATAKARYANQGCHYPSLADDSGLEVESLKGRPGVRSHRYASPKANMTQDQANREHLLTEMKGSQNRSAQFVCTLVLVIEGVLLHAVGKMEGTLTEVARGTEGFGYDPLFVPNGHTQTLAEMSRSEKNRISHRAHALHELMRQVTALGIVIAKP